jgi:murein DD-endopeptidase MepM/ murein hydrolase activator NlpD
VGFNFILTSIALGGFFIVASRYTYLWVVILTPLIAVLIAAFTEIFNVYQLQIYSLPFNLIVILFLYILRYRVQGGKRLQLVMEQNYSPELNLYNQQNYSARFSKSVYFPLELPVRDEWTVTQGYDGKITHRDEWRHAWDFEIENEQKQFYHGNVFNKTSYFCYQKPVYAPGDGWVENIIDNIDDNPIGNVDLEHNWGNTIIIRHAEGLYCNLSHLKKESFKVSIGDYVKRGDVLALCGNSGRSPQPHVHFQLQSLPFVGSTTIQYPISHYIEHDRDQFKIHFFDIPAKGQRIYNINPTQSIRDALKFVPGQKISYKVTDISSNATKTVTWDVLVDYYNNSYLYCSQTKSAAYYHTDGKMFMFTRFYGNKKSELFYFYLSLYRISLGFYPGLKIEDSLPLALVNLKPLMVLQDFLAPIVLFMHSKYEATYLKKIEDFSKSLVNIESKISFGIHRFEMRKIHFNLEFTNFGLEKIEFSIKQKKFIYQQVNIHRTINDQEEHA